MIKFKRLATGFRCSDSAKTFVCSAEYKGKGYPFPMLHINVLIFTSKPPYS